MEADAPRTTWQVAEDLLLDAHAREKLAAYARSRFGIHREDAEDLLQDTALELLHHESQVRKPEGYVFAVFRSRCVKLVTERSAERRLLDDTLAENVRGRPLPSAVDRLVGLREALGGVSSQCRRLLSSHYMEGRSLTETACDLSLRSGSISKLISRCLKRLRACLR